MPEELDLAALRVQSVRAITEITSPVKGEALLVYGAPHGMRFDMMHQTLSASEFALLVIGVVLKRFTAKSLAAACYGFKVVVANSAGTGPESAAAAVRVG